MSEEKKIDFMWDDSPVDISNEVSFILSIANKLRGLYTSEKYKDVIIPMTIIRRFECALTSTKDAVVAQFKKDPKHPAKAMYKVSGYQFYNTSEFTLAELVNDPDNLASNFKSYINGFSTNIQNIINNLDFDKQIDKMDQFDRLLPIVKAFSELDLNPSTIDNIKMGYIFEELIKNYSENIEAGDHYTGRDIVRTMVSIILAEGCDDIFEEGKIITILDQAAGTGGMLSTAANYIIRYNPTADVRLFSQEVNPESYAMCLAEMLIRGQNAENIKLQDTMKVDCFPDIKMRFLIENPPFGTPWGGKNAPEGEESAVKAEARKGNKGRFPAGVPSTSDMQLLFVQSAINKLDAKTGRACIIENASPLFSGGTSSGESQIRRWLLENDYIEAIIQLSKDMFYNTGIPTYIWVISKNKRFERKGKIQLVDASHLCHKLTKPLGNKKYIISEEDRNEITKLYTDFEQNEYCRIYNNTDFIYREYTVMQPLQRSYGITKDRIDAMLKSGALSNLYDETKIHEFENSEKELSNKDLKKLKSYYKNKEIYDEIINVLNCNISDKKYNNLKSFLPVLKNIFSSIINKKNLINKIANALSMMDKTADIQKDKKGNICYDPSTKDSEILKLDEDIEEYMKKKVLPYIPDAQWFFEEDLTKSIIKTGAEIPFAKEFYKYSVPRKSEEIYDLLQDLNKQEQELLRSIMQIEENDEI